MRCLLLLALAAILAAGCDETARVTEDDVGETCASLGGLCLPADLPCPQGAAWSPASCDRPGEACCIPELTASLGQPCARHSDCALGHCEDIDLGLTVCTIHCEASRGGHCPEGAGCYVPGDSSGSCLPTCEVDGFCPEGLRCDQGVCAPERCQEEPETAGCCQDHLDCEGGRFCVGAGCDASEPGRCLERPGADACWTDTDCVAPARRCLNAQLDVTMACGEPVNDAAPGTCEERPFAARGEIVCGAWLVCVGGEERCLGCAESGGSSVPLCRALDEEVSCSDFGLVGDAELRCDGSEDCGEGEACVWDEAARSATCVARPEDDAGVLCGSDADCVASRSCEAVEGETLTIARCR